MEEEPDLVIAQRTRNGLIRYFELASSKAKLLDYQRDVPVAQVLAELIEQFDDGLREEGLEGGWYTEPTCTPEEVEALLSFREIWKMLACLPDDIDSIGSFLSSRYWPPFQREAGRTLEILMKRGYLSDEEPEPHR